MSGRLLGRKERLSGHEDLAILLASMTLELQDVFAPGIVQEFIADFVKVEVGVVIDEELDRLEFRQKPLKRMVFL